MPACWPCYTADDLRLPDDVRVRHAAATFNRPPLARGKVRFVGDIVAAVVAETQAQAVDAAEVVVVDYEPLPAVVDLEAAVAEGAPLLFADTGTNVGLATAPARTTRRPRRAPTSSSRQRIVSQRLAGVPMEANGIASPSPRATAG